MINMNEIVAEQGGLRYPHVQQQQTNNSHHTGTQPPKTGEPRDVYEKQGWYAIGYERFEHGHFDSDGNYVSTKNTSSGGAAASNEIDPAKAQAFEQMKSLLESLKSEKSDINSLVQKHAASAGISDSDVKRLKIEVNASGKIVVGGIKDAKKAKALEQALNNENGLANRIKNFQNNEKKVQEFFEKNNIGGMSLASGAKNLDHIKELALEGISPEELGTVVDDPLALAAMDLYSMGGPDFSAGSKGVADPKGALTKELEKAKKKIEELFNNANIQAEKFAGSAGQPNGAAAAEKMSLTGATIKITADGGITFDGRFAKSDSANSQAEALVRMVIQEMFQDNENSGFESTAATAARQLLVNHDAEFGEDAGKAAVMEISGNKTSAYIDNPEKTNQINQQIKTDAATFMTKESGAKFTADMFQVDERGKLSLVSVPDAYDWNKAGKLLEALNIDVKVAAADRSKAKSASAITIAGLLAERSSYGQNSKFGAVAAPDAGSAVGPDANVVATPDMTAKKSTPPDAGPPPSPHLTPEQQAKRQEAYDARYGTPEIDAAFERWLAGEGDFNMAFLGKTVENGYGLGRGEDCKWNYIFERSVPREDGAEDDIHSRFWTTRSGLYIPAFLDEVNSEQLQQDLEAIKSAKFEDFVLSDGTFLEKQGLTKEERNDFVAMVDEILKETGYTDLSAADFSFRYMETHHVYTNSDGQKGYYSGEAKMMVGIGNVNDERSGSKAYSDAEINELVTYIENRMMETDEFWDKGYAQKMATYQLTATKHGGNPGVLNPSADLYRWK